jgi:hypothetical protein
MPTQASLFLLCLLLLRQHAAHLVRQLAAWQRLLLLHQSVLPHALLLLLLIVRLMQQVMWRC